MKPAILPIEFTQGDDYDLQFEFEDEDGVPDDQSSYTYSAKIRPFPTSQSSVAVWAATVDDTDEDTGIIIISWTDTQTRQMPQDCVWDLQRVDGAGKILTVVKGAALVNRDATR